MGLNLSFIVGVVGHIPCQKLNPDNSMQMTCHSGCKPIPTPSRVGGLLTVAPKHDGGEEEPKPGHVPPSHAGVGVGVKPVPASTKSTPVKSPETKKCRVVVERVGLSRNLSLALDAAATTKAEPSTPLATGGAGAPEAAAHASATWKQLAFHC